MLLQNGKWRKGNCICELLACPRSSCRLSISEALADGFLVPSALRFQSSDFSSTEHTPPAFKMNHFASHQTERTLVKASCRAVFQMAFSRRDLSDIWNCVLNESVRWLVSFHCILCCEFCLAHFCHGIPERNDCWLRVAPQRDLSTTNLKKKQRISPLSQLSTVLHLFFLSVTLLMMF